jgi:hypothetical protein
MRRFALSLLVASLPITLRAQGVGDATAIAGPTFVRYTLGTGSAARTIEQLSAPLVIIVPFGERFTLDVSSQYAKSEVRTGGKVTSTIDGLTDTQVRGNLTLGDLAVVTLGVNVPTGKYLVPTAQQEAAGQIGNDFLVYPVSSMGNGLAATGGVAVARTLGDWNLGVGASFRHSTRFDAYEVSGKALRFTPGDEMRLRVGLDRPVGDGRVSVGVTYSTFGKDAADSTTFSTGGRALAQGALYLPFAGSDMTLSAWNLYRAEGQIVGGKSPWENVSNVAASLGWDLGGVYVQPSAEGRFWNRGGVKAGTLGNFGVRLRIGSGVVSVNPSATYTVGRLNSTTDGLSTDVTGFRGTLLIRIH